MSTATTNRRPMRRREKRVAALLGIPTLALALSTTTVTTYLPVAAKSVVGSTMVIGLIVGLEGLLALWLPLVVGAWSDRARRLGGRLPFLIAGAPVLFVGLLGLGAATSTSTIAIAALVFFAGYFIAYEPYRALYPDAVPDEVAGRAQATQAVWRGAGTGLALLGGGVLLGIGHAMPFVVAAVISGGAIAGFVVLLARRGVPDRERRQDTGLRAVVREIAGLVREHRELRAFVAANALWELALGALKTFVVLYVTVQFGLSRGAAGLIIGGVAVLVLLSSIAWGKLADRYGHTRVMGWALPAFGLGLIVPLVSTSPIAIIGALPFVAAGGGALMALPYAILMPLMPDSEHGVLSGYFSFSRGLGGWLGPLLGGVAISLLGSYQAMWLPVSLAALGSLVPLRTIEQR